MLCDRSARRQGAEGGGSDVTCEALGVLQDSVAEIGAAAIGAEGFGVVAGGVGNGDFRGVEDVVGGPDDFAVGDAGEFGAQAEFEGWIGGVRGDVDEEDGVGTVGIVYVDQFFDQGDGQSFDGADLAYAGDGRECIAGKRDDFEASGAVEFALAGGVEGEKGFFGEGGAARDGKDDHAAYFGWHFGQGLDVGGGKIGADEGSVALGERKGGAASEEEGEQGKGGDAEGAHAKEGDA